MSLKVKNLVVGYYPEVDVINGVSLTAEKGKVTCIIGPNGSGKSTILKTIYGFLKPKKGKIYFKNKEISGMKPYNLVKMGIGYIPQERSLFPTLTTYENLKLSAWNFRNDEERVKKAIDKVYNIFPDLGVKKNDNASILSGGQQRMIEFGRALISGSDTMLVDEPTAGLAPILAADVYNSLESLKESGVTMLLVDQNIRLAMNIADYVYVINHSGRFEEEGRRDQFEDKLASLVRSWIQS